ALPPEEKQPQPVFSLPGFRLPSATIEDTPPLERDAAAPKQQDTTQPAAPEQAFIEPPVLQTSFPEPSITEWHDEAPEPRRLIPPPTEPMSWEQREARQALEEGILPVPESPRLNRAAAGGILTLALVVLLGAFVLSFRREVGETLIRLGET